MREDALQVVARPDGKHEVRTAGGGVLAACENNAQAWRWIDWHSIGEQRDDNRHLRIRQSGPFS